MYPVSFKQDTNTYVRAQARNHLVGFAVSFL